MSRRRYLLSLLADSEKYIESEVVDFVDKGTYEKGGTITTNEYTWVENQLVSNGNFNVKTDWTLYNLSDTTWSVSDNIATIVCNSMTTNYGEFYQNISTVSGHKYLTIFDIKTSANATIRWRLGNTPINTITVNATTSWQKVINITIRNDNAKDTGLYIDNTITTPFTINLRNVVYIDLTVAFGAGNEPTSVNDFRIQNILNKGYIPTNTTGTEKAESTKTLCNLKMLMQK